MKAAILLTPLILLSACSKEEEPSATPAPVKPAATQAKTMAPQGRRNVGPIPAEAGKAAEPAAPADVKALEAFSAKAEALIQEWEAFKQLPNDQHTDEAVKQIREKYTALMKERSELMRGMTQDQRREYGRTILGSMAKVGSGLTTWQLSRGRRNLIPPTARNPQAAGQGSNPPETAPGAVPVPQDSPPAQTEPALGEGTPNPAPAEDAPDTPQ